MAEYPDIAAFSSHQKLPKGQHSKAISNIGIVTFTLLLNTVLLFEIFIDFDSLSYEYLLLFAFASIGLTFFHLNNKYRQLAGILVVSFVLLILEISTINNPKYLHSLVYWFPIVPVAALIINGFKNSIIFLIITTLLIVINAAFTNYFIGASYQNVIRIIPFTIGGILFLLSLTTCIYVIYTKMSSSFMSLMNKNNENQELLKELKIKNEEIKDRNKVIRTINQKLLLLNEKLNSKTETQKNNLSEMSEKMDTQNKILMEYSFINSHQMRAPLARIMGLTNLLVEKETNPDKINLYSALRESTDELDLIIRRISKLLEEGKELSRHDMIAIQQKLKNISSNDSSQQN